MLRALASLLVMLGIAACAADSAGALAKGCTLDRKADLALRRDRNFMLAPVLLNGRPALLVVDTGAEATTITPAAAAALSLPRDPRHDSVLYGISGPIRTPNVRLRQLAIGDVVRADQSLGLGEMPAFPGMVPPVAGLLGTDVLAGYEVELDLPAGRMALYTASGCAGYTPWPGATEVPLVRTRSGLAFVTAIVDGSEVRALLDTGARTTLLARRTAAALGVTDASLASDPRRQGMGIGLGGIDFRRHRFAELGLPGALARDVPANVAELRLPGVEMLLGADYLGPRRVWISYATSRLFLR
jgi:predicted aspartyl protease